MPRREIANDESSQDPLGRENRHFCDPYPTRLDRYGLDDLDRHPAGDDEIERVVILGYN